jgi:hypothetical protein
MSIRLLAGPAQGRLGGTETDDQPYGRASVVDPFEHWILLM